MSKVIIQDSFIQKRLAIPKRDCSVVVKASPVEQNAHNHHLVEQAFNRGFKRYEQALLQLAKR